MKNHRAKITAVFGLLAGIPFLALVGSIHLASGLIHKLTGRAISAFADRFI